MRALEQARLDQIVAVLDGLLQDPFTAPTCLIAVGGSLTSEGDVDLCVQAFDSDPYDALATVEFPLGVWAVGLMSTGWAAGLPASGVPIVRPSRAPDRVRVATVVLVGGSGARSACAHLSDGRRLDDCPEGELVEALEAAAKTAVRRAS